MANKDEPAGVDRPAREAKAEEGERGMSSVAMRARKAKQKRTPKRKRVSRTETTAPAAEEKPEQTTKGDDGEQTIRKGIYLSALIWVEGDWPAARDFTTPAKAAVRDAIENAFDGEHNGLTLKLRKLEVRTDVEEDDGEAMQEEKFEF